MKSQKKTNKHPIFNIEILILVVIAALMIFLINFAEAKFNEVISVDKQALLMNDNPENQISDDFAKEIVNFRP